MHRNDAIIFYGKPKEQEERVLRAAAKSVFAWADYPSGRDKKEGGPEAAFHILLRKRRKSL
ncbi:MAG: hypothetical protein U5N85_07015 [Arcicella sp.]|nr:hypothetical protein [Arcicella sp.]